MEVRIGIKGVARELAIDATQTVAEIQQLIDAALADGGTTFTLTDEKGRRIVVAGDKLAYIEIAESETRRVGFGAI